MGANLLHVTQFASMAPAQFLIAGIWQGLLLTAAAWFALRASSLTGMKISPGTRFAVWMIVFILSAALPFSVTLHTAAAPAESRSAGALFSIPHLPAIWAVAIVGAWALASLFSMARLIWNIYRLDMLARTSSLLPAEALSSELRALLKNSAGSKPGSRPVEICLSDRIDSPVVIGFFRPAVVMPRWLWRKLTSSELNQIVMHEIAHLERRDDWTNLLQKFLRALFPLNPALLLAERQLCWEREMACDDAVLDRAVSPKEYATCLTSLAENRLLRRVQSLAPGAWQRHSELAERVHRVLAHKGTLRPLHARAVVGAFLCIYLCAGVALARCPRLVAFTAIKGQTVPAMAAESSSLNHGTRLVQADLRTDGMRGQNIPHFVDATFRTPASSSPAFSPRVHARTFRGRKHAAPRGLSKRGFAASLGQADQTQIPFAHRGWGQAYVTQATLTETRQPLNPYGSLETAPAALARTLFVQALLLQAIEQSSFENIEQSSFEAIDQSSSPLAASAPAVQLVFYLSPSLTAPAGRTSVSLASADSHSRSGWIVIQL